MAEDESSRGRTWHDTVGAAQNQGRFAVAVDDE
jgi:hypothetical protein